MLKRWLPALFAGGCALAACAAESGDDAATATVRKALQSLGPEVQVESVKPAPLPGFYQVFAAGYLIYVSADGRYMLDGELIDLARRRNVSQDTWATLRKSELARLSQGQGIVFSPPNPKYKVIVFTDVNCEFCRALHAHIDEINREGIAVEYLAWPREGITTTSGRETPTYAEMVSVWCAADRKQAFTAAKEGHAPPAASCDTQTDKVLALGQKLGVSGTPAVFTPDGRELGGYVTARQVLDDLARHPRSGS
jgi:thiol:disulfide interchange protein DsbC